MQKEILDQLTNVSKNSIKPLVAFNTIASRAFERFTKQNLDIFNDAVSTSVNHLQNLANTKKVEDAVALQTQLVKESGSKAISYAQRALEAFVDTSSEFSKWFEEGVSTVVATATGDKKTSTVTSKA